MRLTRLSLGLVLVVVLSISLVVGSHRWSAARQADRPTGAMRAGERQVEGWILHLDLRGGHLDLCLPDATRLDVALVRDGYDAFPLDHLWEHLAHREPVAVHVAADGSRALEITDSGLVGPVPCA